MIDTYAEECALVGALCIEPNALNIIAKYVEPIHFGYATSRSVYEYALDASSKKRKFDPLIIADALKEEIPNIREFLAECMETTPTAANAEEYAKMLREKADERDFRQRVEDAMLNESGNALTEAIAAICSEKIQGRTNGRMRKYSDVIERTYLSLFEVPNNRVDTGYPKLDYILKGIWGKELIIIAARPAVGKSAFALSIAENVAKAGKSVQYYSLEMGADEVGERSIARRTNRLTMGTIIEHNLGSNAYDPRMSEELCDEAARAYESAAQLNIWIDDSPNVKPSKVRAQALTQKDIGMIVVDYGGLMSADRKYDSRNLELGAISRALKNLASELDIPVIMLGQLNRGVSASQKPGMRELRDSGELEQNANKIIALWDYDKERNLVGVGVLKNRKGKCGNVVMEFDGDHMRFTETEVEYAERNGRNNGFATDEDG